MNRDEMIAHLRANLAAVKSGVPEGHWPAHLSVDAAHVEALFSAYDEAAAVLKRLAIEPESAVDSH